MRQIVTCPHCKGRGRLPGPPCTERRRDGHGKAFAIIRQRAGLTRSGIGKHALISSSHVYSLEAGAYRPSRAVVATYAVIARAVGLSALADVLDAT